MTTTSTHVEALQRSIVYDEPGRFAGWPANYGLWAFGDEVVLIFLLGHTGPLRGVHARDLSRPFVPVVARSLDRGETWATEDFTGIVPGAAVLSGDEHQIPELKAEDKITATDFVPLPGPVDFTDSETLVMAARTSLGGGLAGLVLRQHRPRPPLDRTARAPRPRADRDRRAHRHRRPGSTRSSVAADRGEGERARGTRVRCPHR